MSETPETILDFWFGDALQSPAALQARNALWFQSAPEVDAEIRRRFGDLPPRAQAGELDAWRALPRSCLALVLVLDQFPRNLFRDDPRSFASDARALAIAEAAVDRGFDQELHPLEAVFLYLPFEHAEDLAAQVRCVDFFRGLIERAPESMRAQFESFLSFALRHREVIERFGRFPHRNRTLGRASTPDERAYLASGGETFGGAAHA